MNYLRLLIVLSCVFCPIVSSVDISTATTEATPEKQQELNKSITERIAKLDADQKKTFKRLKSSKAMRDAFNIFFIKKKTSSAGEYLVKDMAVSLTTAMTELDLTDEVTEEIVSLFEKGGVPKDVEGTFSVKYYLAVTEMLRIVASTAFAKLPEVGQNNN